MLITRCPHCSTAFKVVPDQLRLGQGWVKCGRCRNPFRAEQHFVQPPQAQAADDDAQAQTAHIDSSTISHEFAAPATTTTALQQAEAAAAALFQDKHAAPAPTVTFSSALAPVATAVTQGAADAADDDHDDERSGPQTLLPTDVVDAIDELVALGAVRPAGHAAQTDDASAADAYATTMPASFMDSYRVEAESGLPAQSAPMPDVPLAAAASSAAGQADTLLESSYRPNATGTLEQWRQNKSSVKFKPPRNAVSAMQIADRDMGELAEQVNSKKPRDKTRLKDLRDINASTASKPWHPEDSKLHEREATDEEDEPSFVADAKKRERWQSWPVRLILSIVFIATALVAAAQLAYLNRHALAAASPAAAPWLGELCTLVKEYSSLPCDVLPLKRIDAVRVESHTLTTEPAAEASASTTYVLNIALKNQLELTNAWPALEVMFTDTAGSLQARRVLQPRDYLAGASAAALSEGMKPLDEQRVAVRFEAPTLRVGGYEITAFYP